MTHEESIKNPPRIRQFPLPDYPKIPSHVSKMKPIASTARIFCLGIRYGYYERGTYKEIE